MHIDEHDLISRAKEGDRDAIDGLVRMHQDVAFRTAYLITCNAEDARDAAQVAMIKAIYALHRFQEGLPFRPWLLRIVSNEARDIRSSPSRRSTEPLDEAAFALRAGPDQSPELTAISRESSQHLLDAVNRLSLSDRQVIAYRYFLGLNEAEMSAALDCPHGTVKSRLSRAMGKLRSQMTRESGESPHD